MSKYRTPSERQLRVAGSIQLALVDALIKRKIRDIRFTNINVSVTHVEISGDLKLATCYVRLLDVIQSETTATKDELLRALEDSKYALRKWIADSVRLKYSPDIKFRYDDTLDTISTIDALLKNVSNDQKNF